MSAIGWLVALALTAGAEEPMTSPPGVFPYAVHAHHLENGLDVYVVPMSTPGVVAYYTWMEVGSRDEVDAGRTGFAHFFEHLMFFGTESMTPEEREQRLLLMGAEENAWTWWDETVYHLVFAADRLPDVIAIESDRFQHLVLTEDDVRKEAGAVYGELRTALGDPSFNLDVAVLGTAFHTHTYRHDTLGFEADIEAMPTAHSYALAFFDRFYRPENANVIIVGDVDPDEVLPLVTEAYGPWTAGTRPRPEIPVEPEQTELRTVEVAWPTETAPLLQLGWKIPAEDPDSRETAALHLVEDYLLSPVGPLRRRIVEEEALAYTVRGGLYENVDPGLFGVVVEARDPEHLERIEAIVREELQALVDGLDASVLDATRTHARYALLSSLDDPVEVAQALGWTLRRGGTPDALDRFFAQYDAVTPEEVSQAVSTWFVDAHLTRGTLVGAPKEVTP